MAAVGAPTTPAGSNRSDALSVISGSGEASRSSPCDCAVSIIPLPLGVELGRAGNTCFSFNGTPVRLVIAMCGVSCKILHLWKGAGAACTTPGHVLLTLSLPVTLAEGKSVCIALDFQHPVWYGQARWKPVMVAVSHLQVCNDVQDHAVFRHVCA